MHTSTGAIYAMIAILTGRPDIQTKAQAEIDQVLGKSLATLTDKKAMPYIQAMLEELMRYTVIIPLGLPHKTTTDTSIGEHLIPKNTEVKFT